MNAKFKIGDAVCLKIDGVIMLVNNTFGEAFEGYYSCVWQDNEGRPYNELYHEDLLVLYEEEAG